MPSSEYFPVGFRLHQFEPGANDKLPFTVFAVKRDEMNGLSPHAFLKTTEKIRVCSFPGELDIQAFQALFKRVSIEAYDYYIDTAKLCDE